MSQRYEVKIFYREPYFEVRIPKRKEPFSWTYAVRAESAAGAVEKALVRFEAGSEMGEKVTGIQMRQPLCFRAGSDHIYGL